MQEVQRFALENIYCSPAQDHQYRFSLIRVTRDEYPAKKNISVYNDIKSLPNSTGLFHVYVIGNLPVSLVNLLGKNKSWLVDQWYNAEEDINTRNILIQVYDYEGKTIPRSNIFYSCTRKNGLIIAIEVSYIIEQKFNIKNNCYIRFYSNEFFNTNTFKGNTTDTGLYCESKLILSNQDKVDLQNKITILESKGGKTIVYVDGYYCNNITLHIPINSLVEIVYDNSIISKEIYYISSLRTFESVKDNCLKYLIFRTHLVNSIQYEDDTEVYITGNQGYMTKGLYYYQHKNHSFNNVTDKDFAINSVFVNNQAQLLSEKIGGSLQDKTITLLTRRSSAERKLVYSSLKLHELYKLPDSVRFDIISNTGYTLHEFRVEQLENSAYFKVASANSLKDITPELATSAIGYNGVKYYYGKSPIKIETDNSIEIPKMYQEESTVYEYDSYGQLLRRRVASGSFFIANIDTSYVEFIQGISEDSSILYLTNTSIPLRNSEYRILTAQYEGNVRITSWEDITDTDLCIYHNGTVTVTESVLKRVRVFYFDRPILKDLSLPFVDGVLLFPITTWEDRGNGYQTYPLDLPYESVEVFLNNNRLMYEVDFFIDFPYISICNKKYIDYTKTEQNIHLRLTGFNLDKEKINNREIRGFVTHGTLTRNKHYDIRDDKMFSTFIDGKLTDRAILKFSEEDSTIRIDNPMNGLPYTLIEHMSSIKKITNQSTLPYFELNESVNSKISSLYNIVYPEPEVTAIDTALDHYYIYSTLVSKVIHDLLDNNIPVSLYTRPYNDSTINELLSTTYKRELKLDPTKINFSNGVVKIHPHYGNGVVYVNIYQYRFITNLIRILTQGNPDKIVLSGYLAINDETVDISSQELNKPGGILVL